jgi:hypothetical protein
MFEKYLDYHREFFKYRQSEIWWKYKFKPKFRQPHKYVLLQHVLQSKIYFKPHNSAEFSYLFHICPCKLVLFFRQFSTSKTDRQQSHYSDGSNINSCDNIFFFFQHKHLNYTRRVQQYLRRFLSSNFVM